MRRIKFKAKCLGNDEWVKGYFYEECNNSYIIEDRQSESMLNHNLPTKVDPATVCQFTGFHDKNGKEIYEGDVLRSDEYPYSCIKDNKRDNYFGIVFYSEEEASFFMKVVKNPGSGVELITDGVSDYIWQGKLMVFEVIGNIHEEEWKQYGEYFQAE